MAPPPGLHKPHGTRVLHQVPEGSIIATPSSASAQIAPLIDFSQLADFIIPRQEFCDRLVTVCANGYRVVGYPVCIANRARYDRNEFMFNMAFVLDETCEIGAYASVVRKLARVLRNLEEQGGFLGRDREELGSTEAEEAGSPYDIPDHFSGDDEKTRHQRGAARGEHDDRSAIGLAVKTAFALPRTGGSKVYALCEMILEDLNNYCECMIPIDDSNTVNLKLFPTRPSPPPTHAHHVPLLTIPLPTATFPVSQSPFLPSTSTNLDLDLTLLRLLPHITGTHSISQLARLADVDLRLARKAIAHLLYYGCVVLLDVFQFGAVYAPTAQIGALIEDEVLQRECSRYVAAAWTVHHGEGDEARDHSREGANTTTGVSPGDVAQREWWEAIAGASQPGSGPASFRDLDSSRMCSLQQTRTRTASISPDTTSVPDPFPSHSRNPSHVPARQKATSAMAGRQRHNYPDSMTLITLYTSLRQGLPLRAWCLENSGLLLGIDVRRFITFGVIKGFLYRVHRYAIATSSMRVGGGNEWEGHRHHQGHSYAQLGVDSAANETVVGFSAKSRDLPLAKYLDGNHCFDAICTDLEMGEREVMSKLKGFGEVHIVNR